MRIPTFAQFQNEADLISQQYTTMGNLEQQASTGHKLISPTDDPVLASQLASLQDYISQLGTYSHNGSVATARNSLYDTTNTTIINTLNDIQKQLSSAQAGSINSSNKIGIANQLQQDLNNLLNAANTTDQSGQFIFSGTNASSPAYTSMGNTYQYQGGSEPTSINIGPNASTLYNDVGSQVFSNIPLGNGTFTVSASGSNTGTAVASSGSVINSIDYVPDTYTISIVTNNEGQPGIQVVGATSGQVVPPVGGDAPAYNPGSGGQDITFNGITLSLTSGASLGDSFTVQPSSNQDIFTTVQGIINTMRDTSLSGTAYTQAMSQDNASISQALKHFITYQTTAGTREQMTNAQLTSNSQTLSNQTILQSSLENVDITTVFSSIMQQSMALQATQAAYLKIEQTLTALLQQQP